MRRAERYFASILSLFLAANMLLSCVGEEPLTVAGNTGDATIILAFSLPNGASARSLRLAPDDEEKVDAIDILALIEKDGKWVYNYMATHVSSEIAGNLLTITVRAKSIDEPQQFVILANSTAELSDMNPIRYQPIEEIDKLLVSTTGGGEWPSGAGQFVPFPMYARTKAIVVNAATGTVGTYPMIRMTARIDVTLAGQVDNFVLKEACLFNYMTAGYVSYANSGFSADKVSTPAVPASGTHTGSPVKAPTVFYAADYSKDPRGEIRSSIYTFESEAIAGESEKRQKTALVVGGYYNGSTTMSYYRIDLKTTDDNSTDISTGILRNHAYLVEVQHVGGYGYEKPQDAYIGSGRLQAEVTSWNQATQSLVFDKQYYLKIELDRYDSSLNLSGDWMSVMAETDYNISSQRYPAGIFIDEIRYTPAVPKGEEWLKQVVISGSDGDLFRWFQIIVNTDVVPPDVTASATIPVRAGNMTKLIHIKLTD